MPEEGFIFQPFGDPVSFPELDSLENHFGSDVVALANVAGEATIQVSTAKWQEVAKWLLEERGYHFLSDLTAAHFPAQTEEPFRLVAHLYGMEHGRSLRMVTWLKTDAEVSSLTPVWPGANWMERECHDLFGIVFLNHPDLRTILLPENWEGHPLRKDYPLGGPQEETIRGDSYGRPGLLPDDLEKANALIEQKGKKA